jgi:hypothetical protein
MKTAIILGVQVLQCGAPPNLFSSIICTPFFINEKVLQMIELKRFGGALNGYPFAPLNHPMHVI